jgi:peptidoglycan hydrolase-like protein with peptidoglycan-binding domain
MKKIFFLLALLTYSQVIAFEITNKNLNDLKFGKTNSTVKQLQLFLNDNGFYETEVGPGSPGNETEYFGETTVSGVKVFQEYSEIPITGKVDFTTGRAINDYIKEIQAEEAQYASDYSENGYKIDGYTTTDNIDNYTDDITDIYLNNPKVEANITEVTENHPQENNKWSLKTLLERTNRKPTSDSTKQKTIFQRFFSIFE